MYVRRRIELLLSLFCLLADLLLNMVLVRVALQRDRDRTWWERFARGRTRRRQIACGDDEICLLARGGRRRKSSIVIRAAGYRQGATKSFACRLLLVSGSYGGGNVRTRVGLKHIVLVTRSQSFVSHRSG